jgi:hypothetical protein
MGEISETWRKAPVYEGKVKKIDDFSVEKTEEARRDPLEGGQQ